MGIAQSASFSVPESAPRSYRPGQSRDNGKKKTMPASEPGVISYRSDLDINVSPPQLSSSQYDTLQSGQDDVSHDYVTIPADDDNDVGSETPIKTADRHDDNRTSGRYVIVARTVSTSAADVLNSTAAEQPRQPELPPRSQPSPPSYDSGSHPNGSSERFGCSLRLTGEMSQPLIETDVVRVASTDGSGRVGNIIKNGSVHVENMFNVNTVNVVLPPNSTGSAAERMVAELMKIVKNTATEEKLSVEEEQQNYVELRQLVTHL